MPSSEGRIDYGLIEKIWARVHNITRRVTLQVGDDSQPAYQSWQTLGYPGELRDGVPRVQEFGRTTMPLPGAQGVTLSNNGGSHGSQAIVATTDPRYRPTGLNGGETVDYMIDGANAQGNGGTLRLILKGALGWITTLFGKTINVGDTTASVTINVGTASNGVTINMGGSSATVNITGASGDVIVSGVSLKTHTHSGVTPGDGNTGEPNT
jgi:phage baseplate assembly protein V